MRLRFKSLLFFILMLIIGVAVIGVGYFFYNEITDASDIVVDGSLTINYTNGNKFRLKGNNSISFSVTNNSDEQKYYYIQFTNVYAADVTYELLGSNDINLENKLKSDIISNQIPIDAKETVIYNLNFLSNQKGTYSGLISVGLKKNDNNTVTEVILSENIVGDKTLTDIGTNATLSEGLLTVQDDQGISYYFRGAVENNNIVFANHNWKILKINGDGSVKIVLDGIIDTISKYYEKDTEFEQSKIKEVLNTWYDENLKNYSDYIAYNTFCNDTTLESNNKTYIAYSRIVTNKIPTFVCLSKVSNSKIGLLTADEVMLAGGSEKKNDKYFLYNKKITTPYYTMTSAKIEKDDYYPFMVNTDGSIIYDVVGNLLRGVRPVVTLSKNVRISGHGTIEEPYKILG